MSRSTPRLRVAAIAALTMAAGGAVAGDDLPAFEKVSEGYTKVTSTAEGKSLIGIWKRDKDAQVLAEIPRSMVGKKFYMVPTIVSGFTTAGTATQYAVPGAAGTRQVYWKKYDKKLALMEPNTSYRSSGDAESKAATKRVYTDRVLLTVPIIAKGLGGGYVVDMDKMLLGGSSSFFGSYLRGANTGLTEIAMCKAFPKNVEIRFRLPRAGGTLTEVHYSLGMPDKSRSFKPREADRRVGFFYTNYTDRAKNDGESQTIRYAHRWNVEKRDPKLKMSPPKEPIVYYIEHTTPIRYRRWVREGILAWNRAFEQVGVLNAIEVRQQDAQTGAYMDIDPEDIRYSFVRWTNSHQGYAIGPSNAHPETGEIYEADIVMDESFITGWANTFLDTELARDAMRGFDSETVAWLDANPEWDPRVRLADPSERANVMAYREALARGVEWEGETPRTMNPMLWADATDSTGVPSFRCECASAQSLSVATHRLSMEAGLFDDAKGDDDRSMIDGLPEDFVGPLLKDVIMHEVGHTLGLMHNYKGTSRHTFAEINNGDDSKPLGVSVMDYMPTNTVVDHDGIEQGHWSMMDIGTYDMWAIEWGYTFDDPEKVATQAADPDHWFMSDEANSTPDPTAKTWLLGRNSIDQAEADIVWADHMRERIVDMIVEDGDSWSKARTAYNKTLWKQSSANGKAAHWIGGAYINRFHKGDENAPDPVRPVEVDQQRRALAFIIDNAFDENSYGLTPELLSKLGADRWFDSGWGSSADLPVQDTILGVQSSALTQVMNPMRLRRIMDNEVRTPAGEDALTVPEVLGTLRDAIWTEGDSAAGRYTARNPMISPFDRNLQREHVDRLISLATGRSWGSASGRTMASLARQELREIRSWINDASSVEMDSYSRAHLADSKERIDRALEAAYIRRD